MMSKTLAPLLLLALVATPTTAKLPTPSGEAKARAAEAAAKTAHAGKVDNHKLCLAKDKDAASEHAAVKKSGKSASAATETPGCTDPQAFAAAPAGAAPAPVVATAPAANTKT